MAVVASACPSQSGRVWEAEFRPVPLGPAVFQSKVEVGSPWRVVTPNLGGLEIVFLKVSQVIVLCASSGFVCGIARRS